MAAFIRPLGDTPEQALAAALEHSPYLSGLDRRYSLLDRVRETGAKPLFDEQVQIIQTCAQSDEIGQVQKDLRQAKSAAHFALAGLDLSGAFGVMDVTRGLSNLADEAVKAALAATANTMGLSTDGLAIFALGKMGAGELNYSSDIDMAAFYDPARFDGGERGAADASTRLVRETMRVLEDRTADGYVFRTDLRLRPDPSSNPLAVSTQRAEIYYESVGQNWERMVWIKGRPAAGDLETANQFQRMIEPFVWRKHLDYWAIEDVRAIKAMINSKVRESGADIDLKLGPGGIREIEFFAQTQQIILGGRDKALRVPSTLAALDALVDVGSVEPEVRDELANAYCDLRNLEHRVQMRIDEQTHSLPLSAEARHTISFLCGEPDLEAFDKAVLATRATVSRHYGELFRDTAVSKQSEAIGNLVFTGVDDDPGTVETLSALGFSEPSAVINSIRQWHRARTPATRSPRGRELLTALLPSLLKHMGETGEPDDAFRRFSRFFEGLRSGVQTLSMLEAEPELLSDLVATLALAPRIADILARRPSLLESLLATSKPEAKLQIGGDADFETAINAAREWHGEQAFLIGHGLLHGRINARKAAKAWSDLADQMIEQMSIVAQRETERRYGDAPGPWAIMALGKLGGQALTAGSDLDLIILYEAECEGDVQAWFTRFTQRLISALSAETGHGLLYEVDMRLRPSGRSGPVATSIASFETYHKTQAWTWEHMALTRIRYVAGNRPLGEKGVRLAHDLLVLPEDKTGRTADILDMRRRIAREKPAKGPWDLKLREGGLVDIEFIVQHSLLTARDEALVLPELGTAISRLGKAGIFTPDETQNLRSSLSFLECLQQIQRLTVGEDVSKTNFSAGLRNRFCRAVNMEYFQEVEGNLERVCNSISEMRAAKIGIIATD